MPHTLAATLTGATTEMGIWLTLMCKLLATLFRTLTLTRYTLTSAAASAGVSPPKLRAATAIGSASQVLDKAFIVFLRLIVLLGPSLHFYIQDRREPAPARGDEYAGAWPAIGHSIKRLCFLLVPTMRQDELMLTPDNFQVVIARCCSTIRFVT